MENVDQPRGQSVEAATHSKQEGPRSCSPNPGSPGPNPNPNPPPPYYGIDPPKPRSASANPENTGTNPNPPQPYYGNDTLKPSSPPPNQGNPVPNPNPNPPPPASGPGMYEVQSRLLKLSGTAIGDYGHFESSSRLEIGPLFWEDRQLVDALIEAFGWSDRRWLDLAYRFKPTRPLVSEEDEVVEG